MITHNHMPAKTTHRFLHTTPIVTRRRNQCLHNRSSVLCNASATPQPLPNGSAEMIDQAYQSIKVAYTESNMNRLSIDLTLPLIGATDLDDWPGGIQQEFKAATPLVESLLRKLKTTIPGLEGPLQSKILDEGDAVGAWIGKNIVFILFPTSDTINDIQNIINSLATPSSALVIIMNPQWRRGGQIIDDFGIFPWVRKAAFAFIDQFKDAYAVQPLRINGDSVKWLYTHEHGWQVNVLTGPRQSECILQSRDSRPTYQEVEATLRKLPFTMSSKSLVERIQAEAEFNRRTAMAPPPQE